MAKKRKTLPKNFEELLEQGADIHAPDGWRRTSLHSRSGSRRSSHIQILLDLGADISVKWVLRNPLPIPLPAVS